MSKLSLTADLLMCLALLLLVLALIGVLGVSIYVALECGAGGA